jgi:uncharacterized protein YxeA
MKKILLPLAALTMSVAVSACSSHDDGRDYKGQNAAVHQDEWHKKHMNMMAENLFNRIDANGDGVITWKEYNQYTHSWFKQADVNNEGELTLPEFKAQMKRDKVQMKADHAIRYENGVENSNNSNDMNYNK